MKKTDKIVLTEKTVSELLNLISQKRKEVVESKTKQFLGNLKDTSIFRKLRREVATLSTHLAKLK